MHFCHEAAALTMRKRTEFVERPGRKKHGRARHAIETRAPNARTETPRNVHNAAPRGITSNSDINAALRSITPRSITPLSITPLSITPLSIAPSSADGIAPRGSGGIVFSGGMAFSGGITLSGAKKRGYARRANKRLVALNESDGIAPVHSLHTQAHRVVSAELVVQNHLRA